MKRLVEGVDRNQITLFPDRLDDRVGEDNAVRVVDVHVDGLDPGGSGFGGVEPLASGHPSCHPSTSLKLHVYGSLDRVQSSRRLEREAGRNVEVMWLCGRLAPDQETVADFRKDDGPALRKACSRFVALCRRPDLLAEAGVAVDGGRFKAANARARNFTAARMARRMAQVEESVERHLHQLDSADRQEPSLARTTKTGRLEDRIARLEEERARLGKLENERLAAPDRQISPSDPDARSMATSGRGSGMFGYNVQGAVDARHHLIVAHEVTNEGSDRGRLSNMAEQAKAASGADALDVVADRGHFCGGQILACQEDAITVTLPRPQTSGNRRKGRFVKADLVCLAEDDVHVCPPGEHLTCRCTGEERGMNLRRCWTNGCHNCAIKDQCTTGKERRIARWEHEHVVEAVERRLDENPDAMRVRRQTVEHPFGTIEAWMGATHFQTGTLKRVRTEMALHVLAYNLKRVMNIVGIGAPIEALQAA